MPAKAIKEINLDFDYFRFLYNMHLNKTVFLQDNLASFPEPESVGGTDTGGPFFSDGKSLEMTLAGLETESPVRTLAEYFAEYFKRPLDSAGNTLDTNVIERIFLINKVVFYDFKNGKDDTRKYRTDIPKFAHSVQIAFQLPRASQAWTIYAALLHDSIEDSHQYDLLKRWYNLKNEDKLEERELSELEALCGLSQADLGTSNGNLTEKRRIVEEATQKLIDQLMRLSGIKENTDTYDKLRLSIDLLTNRPWMGYESFIQRINDAETEMTPEAKAEFIPNLFLIKMSDRLINSYFPAPPDNQNNLKERGAKIIKDGFKNYFVLLGAGNAWSRYSEITSSVQWKYFNSLYNALGYRTAANAAEVIQKVALKEPIDDPGGARLRSLIKDIDRAVYCHYRGGWFWRRTNKKEINNIEDINGSIDQMAGYISSKIRLEENNKPILQENELCENLALLHKFGVIQYILSAMLLSFRPFQGDRLAALNQMKYDKLLQSFYPRKQ